MKTLLKSTQYCSFKPQTNKQKNTTIHFVEIFFIQNCIELMKLKSRRQLLLLAITYTHLSIFICEYLCCLLAFSPSATLTTSCWLPTVAGCCYWRWPGNCIESWLHHAQLHNQFYKWLQSILSFRLLTCHHSNTHTHTNTHTLTHSQRGLSTSALQFMVKSLNSFQIVSIAGSC